MSGFAPVLPQGLDISKLAFDKLTVTPVGAKLSKIKHAGNQLFLQTPEMPITWDAQWFTDNDGNDDTGKFTIKVSFNDMENNPNIKEFYDKMLEFDENLKDVASQNSVEWFKKKNASRDVIDSMFTPAVKVSIDPETGEPNGRYAPTFSFKIKKREGNILCACFKNKTDKFNFNDRDKDDYVDIASCLKKGALVKGLIKCEFVWISPGKFGVTWTAHQLRIKVPKGFDEYAFVNDSDDEEEAEKLDGNFVESDTDEDNDEEEEDGGDDEEEEVVSDN